MRHILTGLTVLLTAAASAQDSGITEFGAKVPALVDSYQNDAPGENAWPLVANITAIVSQVIRPSTAPAGYVIDLDLIARPRKGEETAREHALKALKDLEDGGLFTKLDQLAAARRCTRPAQPGDMIAWKMPELAALRNACRATSGRIFLAFERRDAKTAAQTFEETMAVARIASHDATLISHLVGIAAAARGMADLREGLMSQTLTPDDLRAFTAALDRQTPRLPLSLAFEGERLMHLDTIRLVYQTKGKTAAQMIADLADQPNMNSIVAGMGVAARGGMATQAEATEFAEKLTAEYIAMSRLPAPERLREAARLEEESKKIPEKQVVAGIMLPNAARAVQAWALAEATEAGIRTMLALELHRAEKGAYPDKLTALTPAYLKELPKDPYTGEPLKYNLLHGDPDRRPYLLYSVGLDATDDGGKPEPTLNAAAGVPKGKGYDLIINAKGLD